MGESLDLTFEAMHEAESGFSGCLWVPTHRRAYLLYSGKVIRKGAFRWQKSVLAEAAAIQAVGYRDGEPAWEAELGPDLPVASLGPGDVHRALTARPLRSVGDVVLVSHQWTEESWGVWAIDAATGETRWHRYGAEAEGTQVSARSADGASPGVFLGETESGSVAAYDVSTGALLGELEGAGGDVDAVASAQGALVLTAECVLHGFAPTGGPAKWTRPSPGLVPGRLSETVRGTTSGWIVAEPSRISCLSTSDGSTVWQSEGLEGPFPAVAALNEQYSVVQDPQSNRTQLVHHATGPVVDLPDFQKLMHWTVMGNRLVGSTMDLGLQIVDLESKSALLNRELGDLKLVDVQAREGTLWGLGLIAEDEPLRLVTIDPDSGDVRSTGEAPEAAPFALVPLSADDAALVGPSGVAVYHRKS